VPFHFDALSKAIVQFSAKAQQILRTKREQIEKQQEEIRAGAFNALEDSSGQKLYPHSRWTQPPALNFAPLEEAAKEFERSAHEFQEQLHRLLSAGTALNVNQLRELNTMLMQAGPKLDDEAGLPRRFWYKNQIYAPGEYTGYAANPLPGITDALDRGDWSEAQQQIPPVTEAVKRETDSVNQSTKQLVRILEALNAN
jgi:N-acetylated-alpha-linked acidic dipeptidase